MSQPLALVTGASTGIGLELARVFARNGHDLVVCADDADVESLPERIESTGNIRPLRADLRTDDGVRQLYEFARSDGRAIDVAALNAGVGEGGAFVDQTLDQILSIVALNVTSTTHLARLVLADMVERNAGKVLVTSSIASLMPGAYQAVYNATKSYLQSLTQALQTELSDTNVTLTSLMPGPTDTEFFERADMADNTRIGQSSKDDPAQVAEQGYAALTAGRRRVVSGSISTRVQYVAGVVLPDPVKAAMHSMMAKPKR
jgi:short-subunit dehydrogenase